MGIVCLCHCNRAIKQNNISLKIKIQCRTSALDFLKTFFTKNILPIQSVIWYTQYKLI